MLIIILLFACLLTLLNLLGVIALSWWVVGLLFAAPVILFTIWLLFLGGILGVAAWASSK